LVRRLALRSTDASFCSEDRLVGLATTGPLQASQEVARPGIEPDIAELILGDEGRE
jgi:hypothetical protein